MVAGTWTFSSPIDCKLQTVTWYMLLNGAYYMQESALKGVQNRKPRYIINPYWYSWWYCMLLLYVGEEKKLEVCWWKLFCMFVKIPTYNIIHSIHQHTFHQYRGALVLRCQRFEKSLSLDFFAFWIKNPSRWRNSKSCDSVASQVIFCFRTDKFLRDCRL